MAKKSKSQEKKPADLTKGKNKDDVELKEDELGKVTGGPIYMKYPPVT